MDYCIIMCRSLTYAQRAAKILERENISAKITKAPQGVTPGGCSYGVKLAACRLEKALGIISNAGIRRGRVYRIDDKGRTEELEK